MDLGIVLVREIWPEPCQEQPDPASRYEHAKAGVSIHVTANDGEGPCCLFNMNRQMAKRGTTKAGLMQIVKRASLT